MTAGPAAAPPAPGCVIAPAGETAAALAPLPIAALRVEAEVVTGLARVGFKTVGCIADLPRAPLAQRFGTRLMRRLDQALGREDETITPRRPAADLTAEKAFFDPISHQDDIARAIAMLAQTLVSLLEEQGRGARRLALTLFRVDGHVEALSVASAGPLRRADRIAALFAERIAGLRVEIDAGFGFDLVKLGVVESEPFEGHQGEMLSATAPEDGVAALIDRLGARLGAERVSGYVSADTHIPERNFTAQPLSARPANALATGPAGRHPAPPITRPLWLLARPEPVAAIAEVPDGPPLRFRWRRVSHEIARVEGPERIAAEWWRDGRGAPTRDYFRIEDGEGHRFWIFRQGLLGRETVRPRWFLHGLFA